MRKAPGHTPLVLKVLGGPPHPPGGVKGFLAERQNDGFWRFDPLFFPFLALSSFPAPPSRLPHPLLASDTLRVPPPVFFLLFSHPTRNREDFSGRKILQWQRQRGTGDLEKSPWYSL